MEEREAQESVVVLDHVLVTLELRAGIQTTEDELRRIVLDPESRAEAGVIGRVYTGWLKTGQRVLVYVELDPTFGRVVTRVMPGMTEWYEEFRA